LPFSFIRSIYVPSSFLDKKELPFVLAHEQVHIDKKHSWDKIIITILARVFWFNPLFILFHKELELVHEYQVDETVIKNHSLEKYLESLLQSTIYLQSSPIVLTHSFFSSPIKNRIIMLHKKAGNTFYKRLTSIALLLGVIFSALYMQGRTVQKLPSNVENQKIVLRDTTIKENPSNGTFDMIVTNEDGTVSKYVKTADEVAQLFLNAGSQDSIITYVPEDDEWLLTVDKDNALSKIEEKDTVFTDNGDGSYTMKYENAKGGAVLKVVSAEKMLSFLNRNADANSKWSLGEDNGLKLSINKNVSAEEAKPITQKTTVNVEDEDGYKYTYSSGMPNKAVDIGKMKELKNPLDLDKLYKNNEEMVVLSPNNNFKIIPSEEKNATFPGGNKSLMQYLQKNLKYPNDVKEAGMEGKVILGFKINTDGTISDVVVKRTEARMTKTTNTWSSETYDADHLLTKKLEKESLRVIRNMPNWEPAYNKKGEPTSSKMILPIVFKATE